jgi:hypothetical protein
VKSLVAVDTSRTLVIADVVRVVCSEYVLPRHDQPQTHFLGVVVSKLARAASMRIVIYEQMGVLRT